MNRDYIILNNNKQPIHKFKNEADRKTWEEASAYDNVGLYINEPYIILDFDTKSDADIMLRIVEKLDLHCNIMQTDRGYHFWFRSEERLKNFVKARLAIGIYCDRKVWGRNAYVKIKGDGKLRQWIGHHYDVHDLDFLPAWLTPVSAPSSFNFKGMSEGDGRNQALYNYILVLQDAGLKKSDVIWTLRIINQFVFEHPLPDNEFKMIIRDEAFKSEEELEEEEARGQRRESAPKFDHTIYANALLERNDIITVHDIIYLFKDGYYKQVDKQIERQLIQLCPTITQRQRNEVISYLKIVTYVEADDIHIDPYIVNLQNGRYDLKAGVLLDFDSNSYEFSRLPVTYNPDTYCEAVDKMIRNVFCNNQDIINLFEEILGDCLIRKAVYQKAFVFYGSGSNGKSKLFEMMINFLGADNVSAIPMDNLGKTFSTAELEFKFANIADDLNYTSIKDNGTVKKLITGDAIQVERKYGNPFTFRSYATQIFACNEIPHSNDKSDGMMRRLCLVPCLAKFKDTDADYDPNIIDKVTTEEAKSHLFNLAVRGFRRLRKNNKFTEAQLVKDAKEKYVVENSTVLTWIDEEGITLEHLLTNPSPNLYLDFKAWCGLYGVEKAPSKRTFNKELCQRYNLVLATKWFDGASKRGFVINLEV